jgi:hypothetical protein
MGDQEAAALYAAQWQAEIDAMYKARRQVAEGVYLVEFGHEEKGGQAKQLTERLMMIPHCKVIAMRRSRVKEGKPTGEVYYAVAAVSSHFDLGPTLGIELPGTCVTSLEVDGFQWKTYVTRLVDRFGEKKWND